MLLGDCMATPPSTDAKKFSSPITPLTPNLTNFQTPQLISKKAMSILEKAKTAEEAEASSSSENAAANGKAKNETASSRPPRPPPPMSPPPTFSKRQQVRLAQSQGLVQTNLPLHSNRTVGTHSMSTVEVAAYDLFDSRVMTAVNGWKNQYVVDASADTLASPTSEDNEGSSSWRKGTLSPSEGTLFEAGKYHASKGSPSTPSSASSSAQSSFTMSEDDPMYSALGDALWGGWRSFRDAVKAEALNAALELEQTGCDMSALLRQSEEQAGKYPCVRFFLSVLLADLI